VLSVAIGHTVATAALAALVAAGLPMSPGALEFGAGAWLLALLAKRWRSRQRGLGPASRPGLALALSSFIAATAHGTGLMLVPALVPLCLANSPARALTASGSMTLALAAVGVHLGAMLAVTAGMALGTARMATSLQSRLGRGQPGGGAGCAAPRRQAASHAAGACGAPSASPRTTQPAAAQ
jgi:hypothetical protein